MCDEPSKAIQIKQVKCWDLHGLCGRCNMMVHPEEYIIVYRRRRK